MMKTNKKTPSEQALRKAVYVKLKYLLKNNLLITNDDTLSRLKKEAYFMTDPHYRIDNK